MVFSMNKVVWAGLILAVLGISLIFGLAQLSFPLGDLNAIRYSASMFSFIVALVGFLLLFSSAIVWAVKQINTDKKSE